MRKVYIVGTDGSVRRVFNQNGWQIVNTIEEAEFICLTGGADINPEIYGQSSHRTTSYLPARDAFEIDAYKYARGLGKKVLGICRGAQLMNALEGGDMYQHVNGHAGNTHYLWDLESEEEHTVNSIHHQMMIPAPNGDVIAISRGVSERREKMVGDKLHADYGEHDDPEVIMFKDGDKYFGLGFQGHPEYGHPETTAYFFELIKRYL